MARGLTGGLHELQPMGGPGQGLDEDVAAHRPSPWELGASGVRIGVIVR